MKGVGLNLFAVIGLLLVQGAFNEECTQLYKDYIDWKLLTFPTWANKMGFHEYDNKMENFTAGEFEKHKEKAEGWKTSAETCTYDAENKTQERDKQLFVREMQGFLDGYDLKYFYLAPLNLMDHQPGNLARVFKEPDQLLWKTEEDMQNNLEKLKQIPDFLKQCENLMVIGKGEQSGVKYNFGAFYGIETFYDKIIKDDVEESPFYIQFKAHSSLSVSIAEDAKNFIRDELNSRLKTTRNFLVSYRDLDAEKSPSMNTTGTTKHYSERIQWHTTLKIDDIEKLRTDSQAAFTQQLSDFESKHPDFFTDPLTNTPAKLFKNYTDDSNQRFSSLNECQTLLEGLATNFIPTELEKIRPHYIID